MVLWCVPLVQYSIIGQIIMVFALKIPCTDEEADVDAVEAMEEETEVGTVISTVSNQL